MDKQVIINLIEGELEIMRVCSETVTDSSNSTEWLKGFSNGACTVYGICIERLLEMKNKIIAILESENKEV